MNSGFDRRKLVMLGLGVLVLGVLIWLFSFLTTGKLVVETPSRLDTVSVRRLGSSPQDQPIKSADHALSARLKPGQYIITAGNRTTAVSKFVVVVARQTKKYVLTPKQAGVMEPVLSKNATSLTADKDQLLYLDNGVLQRLDSSGNIQPLTPLYVKAASWVSPSLGVIQDNDNQLYLVSGGSVAPIALPVSLSAADHANFSLSKTGLLAFTKGRDVYSGFIGHDYKKIYSGQDAGATVSAGASTVVIVDIAGQPGQDGESDNTAVITIDSAGLQHKRMIKSVARTSLSPGDKYLYVATKTSDYVYDSDLRNPAALGLQPLGPTAWISDDELAYSNGRTVWAYQPSTHEARQLGQVGGGDIELLSLSADGSYLYVVSGAATSQDQPTILRLGLSGQTTPKNIQALSVFLPETVGVCQLDYSNLAKPVLTVRYPADLTLPENCSKSAQGELKYYDLNPADFQIVVTPTDQASD